MSDVKKDELEKARMKMSDEYDRDEDPYDSTSEDDETKDLRSFDPDKEESEGEDWLKENDPSYRDGGEDDYDEYTSDEDEEAHQRSIDEDFGSVEEGASPSESMDEAVPGGSEGRAEGGRPQQRSQKTQQEAPQKVKSSGRFRQPSRDELIAMRQYTRPWEQRARETNQLKADPSKNPVLAQQGNIVEARNQAHADRASAYRQLTSSDEYKNADPIQQMEMDDKFESDWRSKNPEHMMGAMKAHHEAHEKGKGARDVHAAAKDAAIRNVIGGGGHGGEGYSLEEGMQHAGGARGEEGTQATIKQDPASSFAMGNQDFIRQYAKDYENKNKKVGNIDEMSNYNEGSKRDISRILGEGPSKDPKFEEFFSHYYPLIGMSAHKTLSRLGLDPKHPDIDMSMLHEAGMHGLIQAMNDYDHENPGKASFSTHAGNKIRGLQMTAMKNQDQIPTEVRQAQKKFATKAPKVDLHNMISTSAHPKAADMADRFKRIGAQREAVKIRKASNPIKPPSSGGTSGNN